MDKEVILEVDPPAAAAATWSRNKPPGRALPTLLTHGTGNKTEWLLEATRFPNAGRPGLSPLHLNALHRGLLFHKLKARPSASKKLPIHLVAILALLRRLDQTRDLLGMPVVCATITEDKHAFFFFYKLKH